ncbi:MAG: 3-hydroxyacyl-CoA dehydrogenase NAD-binding domain-containing protein [Brucella sp.]
MTHPFNLSGPVSYEREGPIAIITIGNGAVNALSQAVRSGLISAITHFASDVNAQAAVLMGAGRMFVGGADIKEFGKPPLTPSLPEVISTVDSCSKPVVAAIHSVALGGGFELALGCHYRLAMPSTRLGLPEVTLGLLPGAGGTQRVTRLVGVAQALDFIVSGLPVSEIRALQMGLIDRIGEGDVRVAGIAYARELLSDGKLPRRISEMAAPALDVSAIQQARDSLQKTARGQVAQFRVVDAIEAAARLPFGEGLAEERRLFVSLMETPQRAGLIHAFFVERKVANLPELEGVDPRSINHIGVVGGGLMGAGIATACLLSGCQVTLIERDQEAAAKARNTIVGNLAAAVKRGKLSDAASAEMLANRLATAVDFNELASADVAIEAVFESMDVKKEVFGKLDRVMKRGAILATNTSYLDINEIASVTSRPQDVIGLHFFSPAHVMKLLEVVVGAGTAAEVMATGFALGKKLGKVSVRSGVCDGFVGNRILAKVRGAADRMVLAGASPFQIDRAVVDFGFAMGPYAVVDLAGLDIGFLTRQRKAATRDPRDIVPGWADDLYQLGRLGQKTGRGYYVYAERGRPGIPDPEVEDLILKYRGQTKLPTRSFTDEEIQRRYLAAMINEAARVIDEGIALRPLDVDAVLLFGYGFPRYRGGPMHWADADGLAGLLADIQRWAEEDPYFWAPAPLLERLVNTETNFASLNE